MEARDIFRGEGKIVNGGIFNYARIHEINKNISHMKIFNYTRNHYINKM